METGTRAFSSGAIYTTPRLHVAQISGDVYSVLASGERLGSQLS